MARMTEKQKAYGQVCQAMAGRLLAFTSNQTFETERGGRKKLIEAPYIFHNYTSNVEASTYVLWKLGVFRCLDEHNGVGSCFQLDCALDEVADRAISNAAEGGSLNQLLQTFLELVSEFGGGLSFSRYTPCPVSPDLQSLFDTLCEIEYTKRTAFGFVWTHRVTEIMLAAGLWCADTECVGGCSRIRELE